MRTLEELVDLNEPAMPLVRQWLSESRRPFEVLAPSERSGDVLIGPQVTTRSLIGAITYETQTSFVGRSVKDCRSVASSTRKAISIGEQYSFNTEAARQL